MLPSRGGQRLSVAQLRGSCGLAVDLKDVMAGPDGGGGTAVDRREARGCPDLDDDVVRGGALMPSSLMDKSLPAESEGMEPRGPRRIWTDKEGSGELTCTLLFPLPRLR